MTSEEANLAVLGEESDIQTNFTSGAHFIEKVVYIYFSVIINNLRYIY